MRSRTLVGFGAITGILCQLENFGSFVAKMVFEVFELENVMYILYSSPVMTLISIEICIEKSELAVSWNIYVFKYEILSFKILESYLIISMMQSHGIMHAYDLLVGK